MCKMAECGGSVPTRWSIWSNERLLKYEKDTRVANGSNAACNCSNQNRSLEEFPITTAIFVVCGTTRRMFSMSRARSISAARTMSFSVRSTAAIRRASAIAAEPSKDVMMVRALEASGYGSPAVTRSLIWMSAGGALLGFGIALLIWELSVRYDIRH